MKHYNVIKTLAFCFMAGTIIMSGAEAVSAETLDTEVPGAGITVALNEYVESSKDPETEILAMLPNQLKETKIEKNKYFEDIAITWVTGDDYVNVRKKPTTKSKIVGKVYSNCGARIIETTDNGWYKVKSGNVTGYIKAEYFVTDSKAEEYCLEAGYVFANITDTGIRVRKKPTTESDIVTNVYFNENYVITKFSKNGEWVKIKGRQDGKVITGWVSAQFVKVSIDMDTAITLEEEEAIIAAEKAEAEAAAAAAANTYNNTSNDSSGNTSYNTTTTYSSKGAQIVAYAKRFLGNPYVYGGSSLTNGTDCSGFTMSVYAHFGYSLNRSSYTQVYNGTSVSLSNLQQGDLLFYKNGGSSISHVAIYIGGGQIIHASTESTGIIIGGMGSPCAARRIIN